MGLFAVCKDFCHATPRLQRNAKRCAIGVVQRSPLFPQSIAPAADKLIKSTQSHDIGPPLGHGTCGFSFSTWRETQCAFGSDLRAHAPEAVHQMSTRQLHLTSRAHSHNQKRIAQGLRSLSSTFERPRRIASHILYPTFLT